MNYEKAYKEALERAKKLYEKGTITESINYIFPELKESEDEKIRKVLINYFKKYKEQEECGINTFYGIPTDDILAWLEKQGEFKVGDWVVFNDKHESVYQIEKIENFQYILRHILGGSMPLSFSHENMIRLWSIEDAKDGDVLCYKDEITLYKHDIKNCTKQKTTFGGFVYYCCYNGKRFIIIDSLYSLKEQDKINIHPATKEQRDLLFAKMSEADYEWDAEKKELKKIL